MTDISIVIPLFNEDESLPELHAWIQRVCAEHKLSYEVLLLDDGSTDNSWSVIESLAQQDSSVRGIRMRKNYGKSAALNVGFKEAVGEVVITMDADLQDSPDEIPELRRMIQEEGFDVVSGWKKKRYDPLSKTIPTKLFNWATRKMSDLELHDFNCGLKAYRNEVVKNIEVYGEMHRYIPVIAKWNGFPKIGEKAVEHRARKFGSTKFGMDRFINGFLDLMSLYFMSKFGKRPMHFFGLYGVLSFVIGFAMAAWILIDKLVHVWQNTSARLVTDNPLFYIGLIAMVIGTQLFLAGFLGELVSRSNPERDQYNIRQRTDS
ncbi:MAG: glycosyltransferase family 2 protein [Bacteroidetes bacterium]|nr:glycosyltransferase family 2 protein [Bacteroidota bacterium]MDA0942743.1 glycosyltransferase family 2 protein [Bacteroidota bacterium]MDA1111397.1 glycosyltransferase family 2 protein [Bacteroidota bacterium]